MDECPNDRSARDAIRVPVTLDLFPLNSVLLPGCQLPLHIFEPRYMQMTQDCLERRGCFGIVLITKGSEVADHEAEFCEVGTSCQIVDSQDNSNRTRDIRVVGRQRFRVRKVLETAPLVRAEVEPLPWGKASPDGMADAERLRTGFAGYWKLVLRLRSFYRSAPPLGQDPLQVALTVAASLQLSATQRQHLLNAPGIDDLLEACLELLGNCTRDLQNQLSNRREQHFN